MLLLLLTACGNGDEDTGLSRAEVEEIFRAEMAAAPAPPQPGPGLTSADVEEVVRRETEAMLRSEARLTQGDVERIVKTEVGAVPEPEPGVSAADVRAAIRMAVDSIPEPGLDRDDVEQVVQAAIAGIPEPREGLTSVEVASAISEAIEAIPEPEVGLDRGEVEDIARAAVKAIPEPEVGLDRGEVEEIVRAAVEAIPDPEPGVTSAQVSDAIRTAIAAIPEPDSGLSRGDVRRIVDAAIRDIPRPETGLSADEVDDAIDSALAALPEPGIGHAEAEQIARFAVASIPPRGAQADFTRFFVNNAITWYEVQGLDATLAHYGRPESIDGQWYVFVIDESGRVIGHYEPDRLGLDLNGWVGIDANGYRFGPEMLSATEEGKWVSYVYRNPESGSIGTGSGDFELKNVWVVRHDGLLFASGWYIDADQFTKQLVSIAVARFRAGGLQATVEYFANPGSALAGLEAAIAYYNTAETVDGSWFAFIGEEGGRVVAHSDPEMIGTETQELFGDVTFDATEAGDWVTSESLRVWVAGYGGYLFGSGWRRD